MYVEKISDLRVGETFIQDTYAEVWVVASKCFLWGEPAVRAKVVGYQIDPNGKKGLLVAGTEEVFAGDLSYGQPLIRVDEFYQPIED